MPRGASVLGGHPRIAAGRRNTTVTIQRLVEPESGSGYPVDNWVNMRPNVQMSRLDARGDEHFASSQTSAFIETVFQMPYQDDMDPDLLDVPKTRRLVVSGRVFDIRVAVAMPNRKGIELLTLAGSRLPAVVS